MLDRASGPSSVEQVLTSTAPAIPWPLEEFFSKRGMVPARDEDRRRFARKFFRRPTIAYLSTSLPAFPRDPERIVVYASDISLSGIGFIINRQLYPGEQIQLVLPEIRIKRVVIQRNFRVAIDCYCAGGMFESSIDAAACRNL